MEDICIISLEFLKEFSAVYWKEKREADGHPPPDMNDFYREVVVVRQLIRYQSIHAEHPYLRGMFCSVEIQHLGINVKLIYWVYQDPSRIGLVVEVNS